MSAHPSPQVVAAITAALVAGGYLQPGQRIASIRRQQTAPSGNLWKRAGIIENMRRRELVKL
ncbi:MAG: hypothetical protein ACUVTU_03370 [Desulfurispora sp.]|uniref:hypothetical protein n=1 Tax=Desulfurispora sp. TaxID=3014275 RepID=UPI004049B8BC